MATKAIDAELRLQLTRVLQSPVFERAKRSQHFLRYLVEAALADPAATVKEYIIATEVFDRDSSYDPAVDATVRVEASRLRSRLREYYAEQGRNDPWKIEFPKGSYGIVFTPRVSEAHHNAGMFQRIWRQRIALGTALLMVAFASSLALRHRRGLERDLLQVRSVETLTTDPGLARDPATSPNGTQVAYSWDGEDGISHIYLKAFAGEQSFALSHGNHPDRYPIWTPDGRDVIFARFTSPDVNDIVKISGHGGKETVIRSAKRGIILSESQHMFAWTADQKWLCFPDRTPNGLFQLFLLSLETGFVKPLHAAAPDWDESSPAFSPDGQWVAFARVYGLVNTQIMIQRLNHSQETAGEPIAVSDDTGNPSSVVWLKDGRLVFLSGGSLMQASATDPAAHQFYTANSDLRGLAYDSGHARLITSQLLQDSDIWSLPLKGIKVAAGAPRRLVQSTAEEGFPAFSPDGRWLAFVSTRSGTTELWLADAEGHNPHQLTRLSAYLVGFPRWSSDSRFIVFHARVPKIPEVYILRLEDNSLRQLTDGEPGFAAPSFSIDGRSVYCLQFHAGATLLYRIGVEGKSREMLWPGNNAIEVPGRKTLIYVKDEPGIYERSLAGDMIANPETRLVPDVIPIHSMCVTAEGIFYTTIRRSSSRGEIRFYSFATRESTFIALADANSSVTLKPNRTGLAYDGPAEANSRLLGMEIQ